MKLFFRETGAGQPLIILHGLFGTSDNWVTIARKLEENFRVLIPDLRNHGHSPHSPVFDFPALEDDLLEFIETHELENPILLGHSLGGKTAMLFALHQPERVAKLVVVDISLRRYPHNSEHESLIRAMQGVDMAAAKSRIDVEKSLALSVKSTRLLQFLMKNVYWTERGKLGWRLNLKALGDNLWSVFDGVEVPGEFDGPALFIRGSLSPYISEEDFPLLKKKFPGAVFRTVPNATHWVHADAPGEFYGILSGFLAEGQ
jgi:esterase